MTPQGMMDIWHGDENECHGHCGQCISCEYNYYSKCDEEYEIYKDYENFNELYEGTLT